MRSRPGLQEDIEALVRAQKAGEQDRLASRAGTAPPVGSLPCGTTCTAAALPRLSAPAAPRAKDAQDAGAADEQNARTGSKRGRDDPMCDRVQPTPPSGHEAGGGHMRQLRVVVGDDHAVSSQQNRSQPEPECLDVVGAELDAATSPPLGLSVAPDTRRKPPGSPRFGHGRSRSSTS